MKNLFKLMLILVVAQNVFAQVEPTGISEIFEISRTLDTKQLEKVVSNQHEKESVVFSCRQQLKSGALPYSCFDLYSRDPKYFQKTFSISLNDLEETCLRVVEKGVVKMEENQLKVLSLPCRDAVQRAYDIHIYRYGRSFEQ